MFCPNCGTKVADSAAFCPSCGKQLNRMSTKRAELEQIQAEPETEQKEKTAETSRMPEHTVM